jgi:hypothetical protein
MNPPCGSSDHMADETNIIYMDETNINYMDEIRAYRWN